MQQCTIIECRGGVLPPAKAPLQGESFFGGGRGDLPLQWCKCMGGSLCPPSTLVPYKPSPMQGKGDRLRWMRWMLFFSILSNLRHTVGRGLAPAVFVGEAVLCLPQRIRHGTIIHPRAIACSDSRATFAAKSSQNRWGTR